MTISAGTKLGSYEVLKQIGAGGMGEVYRSRDTHGGRMMALAAETKIVPGATPQAARPPCDNLPLSCN
jgi:hypothetical protein